MRKFFIFLLLIINLNTFAFTGGVKGGINYTIPQFSRYNDKYSGDFGYNLGGYLKFNIYNDLYFNTELFYSKFNFDYENVYGKTSGTDSFTSADVILALSYNFFDNLYFDLGLFLGMPIEYKYDYKFIYDNQTGHKTGTPDPDIVRPSAGYIFGVGYKYQNYLIYFKYNYISVFPITEHGDNEEEDCENNDTNFSCLNKKLHQFQLLVGYEF